jgi:hypothetical protein
MKRLVRFRLIGAGLIGRSARIYRVSESILPFAASWQWVQRPEDRSL